MSHKVDGWNSAESKKMGLEERLKLHLSVHLKIIPNGEEKAVKALAPAANHVQQPWNVYSQVYTRAAWDSIATQIKGRAFWGCLSLGS